MKNKIVFIGYSGHSYGCVELAINQGLKVQGYFELKEKKKKFVVMKKMSGRIVS